MGGLTNLLLPTEKPIGPVLALEPDLPVGGRLSAFTTFWTAVTQDQWVLDLVKGGYKLEFASVPPFTGLVTTRPQPNVVTVLSEEVEALVAKAAVEAVPVALRQSGYYSTYFIVPKKDGGLRPILNLKWFNHYMMKKTFRMETLSTIISIVRPGQWLASVDLKDAYFHVPIHPAHWRFLRFMWRGQAYQFKAMPFGLTSAPRVFTKVLHPLLAFLRIQGVRIHVYLDDVLVVGDTRDEVVQSLRLTMSIFLRAGFILNLKKSDLDPTQDLVYIGGRFRTDLGLVALPQARWMALHKCVRSFMQVGGWRTALQFLHLLGLMNACITTVTYARLYMRPIQWYVKDRWSACRGLRTRILIQRELLPHLEWWTVESHLCDGTPLQQPPPTLTVTTDASVEGWGGHLQGSTSVPELLQGEWSAQERRLHINVLELRAIRLTLMGLTDRVRGQSLLLESDNSTAVAYVNKQGGVRSRLLNAEASHLSSWLIPRGVSVRAVHRPGVDNQLADFLSRHRADPTEWTVNAQVVQRIFDLWGTPQIDLFASARNHRLPLYCSRTPDQQAVCQDALSMTWTGWEVYCYPPLPLLLRALDKIRREKVTAVVIAPRWPRRPWYSLLLELCAEVPRLLPLRRDLLTQVLQDKGRVRHPDLETLHLAAWKVSGDASVRKAFLRRLLQWPQQPSDPPPGRSMTVAGRLMSPGVEGGVSLPMWPL